jgi:hypothetical protein
MIYSVVLLCVVVFAFVFIFLFQCDTNILENYTNKLRNTGRNIVLIGDSMLDNSPYVLSGQSVSDLISKDLENKTGTTLYNFAKDGATINDCYSQLDKVSTDLNSSNTSIFLSVGGNNILNSRTRMNTTAIANLFDQYLELIKSIKSRIPNAQLYALNLYFPVNSHYKSYYDSITQWNKLLEDNTFQGYKLIQTNKLLVIEEDFTYDIEPSFKGGGKIAKSILDSS